jgi:glycine/D-amino acid oxidase-like deaminating enzyme
MDLAASEQELAEMREEVEILREDGWDVTFVEQADLPPRLRGLYLGGIFHPGNSEVHPVKYVTGLALLASQAGASLYKKSPVIALTEHEQGVTLTTTQGMLHAGKVILAANAWLPELARYAGLDHLDWLTRAIVPTRGQVLVTEPVAEMIFPCPWVADYGYHYCRQVEGRLLIGGWRNQSLATENVLDETPGREIQQHLENFLYEKLSMPAVKIETRWAGVMAFTSDYLPLVGLVPGMRHCLVAGGYTGHGNAYAVHSAQMVSKLAIGETHTDVDLFAPGRFQSL